MKIVPMRPLSPKMRTSQQRAMPQPAPAAAPLTAAMIGTSHAAIACASRTDPDALSPRLWREGVGGVSPRLTIATAEAPEQNPRPAPVMISARTASSDEARSTASISNSPMSPPSEFSVSGRLRVTTITPSPRMSVSTESSIYRSSRS